MINLFLDLDGTLAKFNSKRNALKRFDNEIGFFANLKPYKYIEFVNELANNKNVNVYIISATPNDQADQDKLIWIRKYLNNIKEENICFSRIGENKAREIFNRKDFPKIKGMGTKLIADKRAVFIYELGLDEEEKQKLLKEIAVSII